MRVAPANPLASPAEQLLKRALVLTGDGMQRRILVAARGAQPLQSMRAATREMLRDALGEDSGEEPSEGPSEVPNETPSDVPSDAQIDALIASSSAGHCEGGSATTETTPLPPLTPTSLRLKKYMLDRGLQPARDLYKALCAAADTYIWELDAPPGAQESLWALEHLIKRLDKFEPLAPAVICLRNGDCAGAFQRAHFRIEQIVGRPLADITQRIAKPLQIAEVELKPSGNELAQAPASEALSEYNSLLALFKERHTVERGVDVRNVMQSLNGIRELADQALTDLLKAHGAAISE